MERVSWRAATSASLAIVLAACAGASADVLVEQRSASNGEWPAPTATTGPPATTETLPTSGSPSTIEPAPTTTITPTERRLSIDDALMDDGDVEPPWEFQYRDIERPGYGAGPNQTDCAPYWRYEERYDLSGGAAMWFVDGGNVNHEVYRAENAAAAADFVAAMSALPVLCPVTSWSEGDSFRIDAIDLGDDEIVGLEFIDGNPEQLHHTAISAHGDLISVVWVVQWPRFEDGSFPHTSTEDVARWAGRAHDRLTNAGEAPPATTSTTTTTPVAPPPTTSPPSLTTLPAPTTEPPPDPAGLAQYLISDADLEALPGWSALPPEHSPSGGDDDSEFLADCPTRSSIDELGRLFEVEVELNHESSHIAHWQYLGEAVDDASASALVHDVAALAECRVSGPEPIEIDGGLVEGTEASVVAALDFSLGDPDGDEWDWFRLVVMSSGPRVTALAFWMTDLDDEVVGHFDRLLELAAAKLAG